MEQYCAFCGKTFTSRNARRLYCSAKCRRDAQNERRMDERAEAAEARETEPWDHDPWDAMEAATDEEWDVLYGNMLLDAAPWEVTDNPWGGPQFNALPKQARQLRRKKDKHKGQAFLPGMEAWLVN